MKKTAHIITLFLLLLSVHLQAASISAEQKIYRAIFRGMFPHISVVKIWTDAKHKKDILSGMRTVRLVSFKEDADLLLLAKKFDIESNKIIFVSSYPLLKRYKDVAVGGFYWKKGRPNLLFLRKNLQKHNIVLPEVLQKYVDDEL